MRRGRREEHADGKKNGTISRNQEKVASLLLRKESASLLICAEETLGGKGGESAPVFEECCKEKTERALLEPSEKRKISKEAPIGTGGEKARPLTIRGELNQFVGRESVDKDGSTICSRTLSAGNDARYPRRINFSLGPAKKKESRKRRVKRV